MKNSNISQNSTVLAVGRLRIRTEHCVKGAWYNPVWSGVNCAAETGEENKQKRRNIIQRGTIDYISIHIHLKTSPVPMTVTVPCVPHSALSGDIVKSQRSSLLEGKE